MDHADFQLAVSIHVPIPGRELPFVDLAIAVIVFAIAYLCCAGVHLCILIIAVTLLAVLHGSIGLAADDISPTLTPSAERAER